jgi:ATP-dependent Clp protease ATP-binding subunit ClpC
MNYWHRLDADAAVAVRLASDEAAARGGTFVTPHSLLLGILREGTGVGARVLSKFGLSLRELRQVGDRHSSSQQVVVVSGRLPLNVASRVVMARAIRTSRRLRHPTTSSAHLLIALLESDSSEAAKSLAEFNTNPAHVRIVALESIGAREARAENADSSALLDYPSKGDENSGRRRSWLQRLLRGAKH